MIQWRMDPIYNSLINHLEKLDDKWLKDAGQSIFDHIQTLLDHLPPGEAQARILFEKMDRFHSRFIIARDLQYIILKHCGAWSDIHDTWFWKACGQAIHSNDAMSLAHLMSQPGAPRGDQLSVHTLYTAHHGKRSLVQQAIETDQPSILLDQMTHNGLDLNTPCFFSSHVVGLPISYKPSAARTIPLLTRGARLNGDAPDKKPIWTKVLRSDLSHETMADLLSALSEFSSHNPQIRADIQSFASRLPKFFASYCAKRHYADSHLDVLKTFSKLATSANLSLSSRTDMSGAIALWAHSSFRKIIPGNTNKNLERDVSWQQISREAGIDDQWNGACSGSVPDGVWALIDDANHLLGNISSNDVSAYEGKNPDQFWISFEDIILNNQEDEWTWKAVSRLRQFMPEDRRDSMCNAVGRAFYKKLDKNPAKYGKSPMGGMSVLTQALKTISEDEEKSFDTELANLALSAHILTGMASKKAKKALEKLARNPPDWLDIKLVKSSFERCTTNFSGSEKRDIEAWVMAIDTPKAAQPNRGSLRL